MKKSKITKRLSLRAKFKSTDLVEVTIMDDANNIQIEMIPIRLKFDVVKESDDTDMESDDKEKEVVDND